MSDSEIVNGILNGDEKVIRFFFFDQCSKLFSYIILAIFGGRAEKNELMNELFLYLAKNDWHKLREFDFRSSLLTWISVVAVRFFTKKRNLLIEKESTEALIKEEIMDFEDLTRTIIKIDLEMAINNMSNKRNKEIIIRLDIDEIPYETVAKDLGVTVSNLYNIHRRALAQLKLLLI